MHAWVSGRVQGVYFRQSTVQQARLLGVRGWVRNLPDGRVEVMFEGEADAVQLLSRWLAHGPEQAQVTELQLQELPLQGFTDFQLLR